MEWYMWLLLILLIIIVIPLKVKFLKWWGKHAKSKKQGDDTYDD